MVGENGPTKKTELLSIDSCYSIENPLYHFQTNT